MASWTKLKDGNWGIRSTEELVVGSHVSVKKADGSSSKVPVGAFVTRFNTVEKETIFLYQKGVLTTTAKGAEAQPKVKRARGRAPAYSRAPVGMEWRPCGYPGCNPRHCDECQG